MTDLLEHTLQRIDAQRARIEELEFNLAALKDE